jgi:thioredoxin-like negative regulator of GroEL
MKSLALAVAAVIACTAPAQVQWNAHFAEASKAARAANKPLLVDFFAEWCGPCKMMDKDAFGDATVRSLMKRVVPVRLNVDDRPPEAEKYGVESIPRVLLLSSDGKSVLMDVLGYQDGKTFAAGLAHALGVKLPTAAAPGDPTALTKVRAALAADRYYSLKATDPKTARAGLSLLVERLGAQDEAKYRPVASLIEKAGSDALPALVQGMGHKHLAVRAASYRTLLRILGKNRPASLTYDPWARSGSRKTQLAAWQRWLRSRG